MFVHVIRGQVTGPGQVQAALDRLRRSQQTVVARFSWGGLEPCRSEGTWTGHDPLRALSRSI
jgi:hypothetical protein